MAPKGRCFKKGKMQMYFMKLDNLFYSTDALFDRSRWIGTSLTKYFLALKESHIAGRLFLLFSIKRDT